MSKKTKKVGARKYPAPTRGEPHKLALLTDADAAADLAGLPRPDHKES